jgi:hypothetical protein
MGRQRPRVAVFPAVLGSGTAEQAAIDTGGIERVQLHADLIISPGRRECSLTPELLRWRTPPSSSAAQLGQELRPSARCRCTMGPKHRLVAVLVYLAPVDAPKRWVRVVLDRT